MKLIPCALLQKGENETPGKQEEEELENEEEYIRNLSAQTGFPAIKLSEVTINRNPHLD